MYWPDLEGVTERFGEWPEGEYHAIIEGKSHGDRFDVTFQTNPPLMMELDLEGKTPPMPNFGRGGRASDEGQAIIDAFGGQNGLSWRWAADDAVAAAAVSPSGAPSPPPPPAAITAELFIPMVIKALQTDIKGRWVAMQKVEAQRKAQPIGTAGRKSPGPDDWPTLYEDFKSEHLRLYNFYVSNPRLEGRAVCGHPDNRTYRPKEEMEALHRGLADQLIRALLMPQKPASAAKQRFAAICDANDEARRHFGERKSHTFVKHAEWKSLGVQGKAEEVRLRDGFTKYGSDPNYVPPPKEFKPDARAPKRKLK